MARRDGDQLDRAHEELRAWCHARPDLQDPSRVYGALGSINAILATLEHVVGLVGRTASRASRADDYITPPPLDSARQNEGAALTGPRPQ